MKERFTAYAAYLLLFTLCAAAAAVIPTTAISEDILYWINWSGYMQQHGFGHTYDFADNNYNPFFQYVLLFYIRLINGQGIAEHVYLLKILTLLFDFGAAVLAATLLAGRRQLALALLLLLNLGYLYNTLVWGQVDSIYTCLLFIAIVLGLRERPVWSALFYVLSVNAKLQALVLLPVLLLLWLPLWARTPRALPWTVLAAVALQALLVLPFVLPHGLGYLTRIYANTFGSIEYYPVVSMHCYNLWHLLLWKEHKVWLIPDSLQLAGITYRHWGIAMFLLSSAVLLLPLALTAVRHALARQRFAAADYGLLFLTAGLVPILLSYFNTQMHSRYVHPGILLLACYAFVTRRHVLFLLASGAYFLNLTAMINIFTVYDLKLSWNPWFNSRFVAGLYTLVVAGGLRELYRHYSPGPVLSALLRRWPSLQAPEEPAPPGHQRVLSNRSTS
ncbi:hypothetical protein GCM10027048_27130 [Hymenobacter coalescens]